MKILYIYYNNYLFRNKIQIKMKRKSISFRQTTLPLYIEK